MKPLEASLLGKVIQVMREAHGCDLAVFEETFLAKSLTARLAGISSKAEAVYLDRLAQDRVEAEELLRSLKIGHTEFFRDPLAFALLERVVLPGLIEQSGEPVRAPLRIWSAGCSTGQEAWSVAILLEESAALCKRPVPFQIFATDVSAAALAVARKGVYDQAAVQHVRLKHVRDFFSAQGEACVVAPRLRDRVDFSTYDLLDEHSVCPPVSLYGDFDLILCCNLLFYYRPDIRGRILDKIHRALSPGGYLMTGETEREIVAKHNGFRTVAPPAAVFQKRGTP